MSAEKELSHCLARMARYSSQDWGLLLRAYRAYSDTVTDQLVTSPLEQLPIAQGRCRQVKEFLRMLEAATKADT
jgi:hypothetical protein